MRPVYHHLNVDDVLRILDSSPEGISSTEAKLRLNQYGANALKDVHKRSAFWKLVDQFKDLMVGILFAAAIVSLVV